VQRPIPVWLGGGAEAVIRRVARIADGWMPQFAPDANGRGIFERMRDLAREYGRDPDEIGLDGRVAARGAGVESWAAAVEQWREIGATHLSINTMGDKARDVDDHLGRLRRLREALG
jgi:alkanesulfonate monooxygenase SsuD/methylene tetrahydromethanopterin reductase-like flavin-dependent oxidoreductase (luciferase family)